MQLSLRHCGPTQLTDLLGMHMIDAGILGVDDGGPAIPAGATVQTISEEPLRLVCAADDPLAGTSGHTIQVLRGVPVVLAERASALRELVLRSCQAAGFSPLPLFETSDRLTIRSLVAEELGYSAVPASWLAGDGPAIGVADFADPVPVYRVALVSSDGLSPVGALLVEELLAFFG